ncbi:peptide MFS transporter [Kangiella sediminilitoris]|uniref:Amino acid/peptide transporter n=1 Tax=Kangiella sediminilitoris TaxID=1144748 RepID=A0A1B3BCE6_9GAMM|nr:peptide MFS transporter [Kangiella sediminilitoris]AOE50423.1 Amino acid/peptide transporter [Kangiella sediminilitoris]
MTAETNISNPGNEKTFLGHPRGLIILFFTEMWERFSYYGMRGLLIIYLTQHFLFSDEKSTILYGAYTALVYVMTIIGGSLADRYLGTRKAVTFGAILLVMGHIGMAFEGSGSKELMTYADKEYQLTLDGRGGDARQIIKTDKGQSYVNFGNQTLEIGNASALGLPSKLGGFDYSIENGAEEAQGKDKTVKTLTYNGQEYQLIEQGVEDKKTLTIEKDGVKGTVNMSKYRAMTFGTNPTLYLSASYQLGPQVPTKIDGFDYEVLNSQSSAESITKTIRYSGNEYTLTQTGSGEEAEYLLTGDNGKSEVKLKAPHDLKISSAEALNLPAVIEGNEYQSRIEKQPLYVNILYLSLALIIAGVGFLKANISTIVGSLYGFGDTRRDSGFTLFYMGINLGSLLSSLTCGIIGIVWGWAYGFGLAGIGMVFGLVIFIWKSEWLEGKAEPPNPAKLKEKVFAFLNYEWMCYLIGVGIIAISMFFVMNAEIMGDIFGFLGIGMFLILIAYAIIKLEGDERHRMFAAIYFILAQIPFWALFEQAGSSLNLFTDRLVDRSMMGWVVPAPVFQSLNAAYIIMFAPILAWLWSFLAKRKLNPPTPVKFAMGVFLCGFGFLTLVGGIEASGEVGYTAVYFIFLIYLLHTLGELMVSPVGLSAVTKLAPAQAVGMTMGAWFLYSGLSNFLAGVIAKTTGAETIGGQLTDVAAAKATYADVYTNVSYVAMGIAVFMLIISPLIKKLMEGAE